MSDLLPNVSPSRSSQPSRVLGILLIYYENYLRRSIYEFSSLLHTLDSQSQLLVVVNNEELREVAEAMGVKVVQGDNRLQEFSGWQVGISHAHREQLLPPNGIVVFANDTFCHHNRFGAFSRLAFAKVFRRILSEPDQPAIAGDMQRGLSSYAVGGQSCPQWISTYLFAINSPLLHQHRRLFEPNFDLQECTTDSLEPSRFVTSVHVSPALQHRITKWLFPDAGKDGWHGGQSLTQDSHPKLAAKVRSIVLEKHLSAAILHLRGRMYHAFESRVIFWLRKLERRPCIRPRKG